MESGRQIEINLLDCLTCDPSPILGLHFEPQEQRLYVSRTLYSQVYQLGLEEKGPLLQQLAELQPSLHCLQIQGWLALFQSHQLKAFGEGRWQCHSFSTQLRDMRHRGNTVFTFHQNEVLQWDFEEQRIHSRTLPPAQQPYHIDQEGTLVGLGKRTRPPTKGSRLTACEVVDGKWVFAGDDRGALHIFDWSFLSLLKTFHLHQAPLLCIKAEGEAVYFSGSDSRVGMARAVGEEWVLGGSLRGQTHDVLSLQVVGNYLLSGGITTDFCFMPLTQDQQFTGDSIHRVSYCGAQRISTEGSLLLINKRNSFELWKMGSSVAKCELLVRYELGASKFLVDCRLCKQEGQEPVMLLATTDEETVGWQYDPEEGLRKYITIQNQYTAIELLPRGCLLGLRSDGLLERVSLQTGRIEELLTTEVQLPTELKYLGQGLVLVASRVTSTAAVLDTRRRELLKEFTFSQTIGYIDQLDSQFLLLQYFGSRELLRLNIENEQSESLVTLPVSVIRFGGWLQTTSRSGKLLKAPLKKYWWGASEGKVIVVSNLLREAKKKVRVRQTERIAQVVRPGNRQWGCNLALVPYNFSRMAAQLPLRPVFTKKII